MTTAVAEQRDELESVGLVVARNYQPYLVHGPTTYKFDLESLRSRHLAAYQRVRAAGYMPTDYPRFAQATRALDPLLAVSTAFCNLEAVKRLTFLFGACPLCARTRTVTWDDEMPSGPAPREVWESPAFVLVMNTLVGSPRPSRNPDRPFRHEALVYYLDLPDLLLGQRPENTVDFPGDFNADNTVFLTDVPTLELTDVVRRLNDLWREGGRTGRLPWTLDRPKRAH